MKSFKKIIVPAIAAIALCLSLIAGATYAWFTDEAKTNVNTIQSGKLDVALEMKEGDGWVSAEGKTLSFLKMNAEGELVADENVLWEPGCTYKLPLLRIVNNSNVAIKYTVMFNGATGDTVVQVEKGTLIINGGFFACEPYSDAKYGYKYLINCIDAAWKNGTAKVSITGGTFVNFDPMDSASENPHGNFLAEGYKTVATTQANGDIWYTVVKA